MNQKLIDLLVFSVVILFLPVAVVGLIASVNEYADQGIVGAVDCNGPFTVLVFIALSLAVYSFGASIMVCCSGTKVGI